MRTPTDTHLRRKSSHIERWLDDQHRISALHLDGSRSEESIPSIGTKCHPYLAYPHLSVASLVKSSLDERSPTIESFVLVDDVPPILRQDASVQQVWARSRDHCRSLFDLSRLVFATTGRKPPRRNTTTITAIHAAQELSFPPDPPPLPELITVKGISSRIRITPLSQRLPPTSYFEFFPKFCAPQNHKWYSQSRIQSVNTVRAGSRT